EEAGLRAVHRAVAEVQPEDDGQPDEDRLSGVEQPEEGKGEQSGERRPKEVDGTPTQSVGERAEQRYGDQLETAGEQHAGEDRGLRQPQRLRNVGEDEGTEDVEE